MNARNTIVHSNRRKIAHDWVMRIARQVRSALKYMIVSVSRNIPTFLLTNPFLARHTHSKTVRLHNSNLLIGAAEFKMRGHQRKDISHDKT